MGRRDINGAARPASPTAASTQLRSPERASAASLFRLWWSPRDLHLPITIVGLLGAAATVALMFAGLPEANMHGPWHEAGIVDPLCGGTRAAYYTARGDLSAAWRYNPAGILAVLAAVLASLRAAVGLFGGRWATVSISWTWRRAAVVVMLLVAALVALQVRQQMQADMLLAPWSVP